jgi:hypothetical protein
MSTNSLAIQHYSSETKCELPNVIAKKAYLAPKLIPLLHETHIAGSNQTNVAEGTGGFLAVGS